MPGETRGGASKSAELALAPGADHGQAGLIACYILDESDAWIAVGDGERVVHTEMAELSECFFGVGPDAAVDTVDESWRPLRIGGRPTNDRGRHAQRCTEPR
jgi:hypothetical protein